MKNEAFCRQCLGACVPSDCMAIKMKVEKQRAMEV